ncbi:DUF3500 domain-containing protein [Schlesneria paludicola]|uniref:DUF3500 domain-containing protein n=1 Tax=Schlesneria paludicola TaxID=360056 RepID=UPI0012FA4F2B|nr:DUF3500 domain-containing protein [Schlesneria paludicola]
MDVRKFALTLSVAGAMAALLTAQTPQPPTTGVGMAEAAKSFLTAITPDQRQAASFKYDDPERLNWHFIPRERKGLPLKALEGPTLHAAMKLIRTGLSDAGYDQALNVMSLEEVLYLIEPGERAARRERRDPSKYYLSIFGTPAEIGLWGWRLEGHHLCLNFSIKDGKVISSTPEFFGANPGTIDAGKGREIRVLGPEEDIARQILKLCTPEQQAICWVSKEAPGEVPGPNLPQPVVGEPVGLPVGKMSADQKQLIQDLLNEYLKNLPADVEKERRDMLKAAGVDKITFAWFGQPDLHEAHHYRVQGPTFVIEYNNTQNNANHVHSMWRNLAGDFALPAK